MKGRPLGGPQTADEGQRAFVCKGIALSFSPSEAKNSARLFRFPSMSAHERPPNGRPFMCRHTNMSLRTSAAALVWQSASPRPLIPKGKRIAASGFALLAMTELRSVRAAPACPKHPPPATKRSTARFPDSVPLRNRAGEGIIKKYDTMRKRSIPCFKVFPRRQANFCGS